MMGFVVDLFCGLGGFSEGARMAGVHVDLAVNHWNYAISTHGKNHPETHHSLSSVWELHGPEEASRRFGGECDLMLAAPECTDHSHAKGGGARDGASRSLPNAVLYWASRLQPKVLIVENVPPMTRWGPLDKHGHAIKSRVGEDFERWVRQLRGMGYVVDWRVLCAADYGAPTSRRRLFVVARRDGLAPTWPEPTHGEGRPEPWVSMSSCIDWTLPMCSVFATPEQAKAWGKHHGLAAPKRPLAPATMARIMEGLRRMQDGRIRPFLVTTANGLMVPILTRAHSHGSEAGGWAASLGEPLPTATRTQEYAVAAAIIKHYGGETPPIGHGLERPLGTITTTDHHSLMVSYLVRYQGTGGQWADLHAPMLTQPTLARFGLVTLEIDGQTWAVVDILFRMLRSPELAAASSFPAHYDLGGGSERDRIAGIGNAIPPKLAAAVIAANNPRVRGRVAA